MARKFFYVCAGILMLALSYHVGASRAIAQAPQNQPPLRAIPIPGSSAMGAYRSACAVLGSPRRPTTVGELDSRLRPIGLRPVDVRLVPNVDDGRNGWALEAPDGTTRVVAVGFDVFRVSFAPARKGSPQPFLVNTLRKVADGVSIDEDKLEFRFKGVDGVPGLPNSSEYVAIALSDGAWIGTSSAFSWEP